MQNARENYGLFVGWLLLLRLLNVLHLPSCIQMILSCEPISELILEMA